MRVEGERGVVVPPLQKTVRVRVRGEVRVRVRGYVRVRVRGEGES